MDRIKITETDEYGEVTGVAWFDRDAAEQFKEGTEWDGNNHRGVISGLQIGGECLYRTKGGRWVRYYDASSEFNGPEFYEFITDDAARVWLLRADEDAAVEKYFGELEDEKGPGRPEVGPATNVRLGEELTAKVDGARRDGESRAAAIRRLLTEALA
jgi:hypothetical protein